MLKLQLDERIVQYRFPPEPGKHYGFNLTALLDRQRSHAVLIDTAFEPQAAAVLDDLTAAGITPDGVIVSHFHPDHVHGLRALPRVPVLGSAKYEATVSQYTEAEERELFTPTDAVEDGDCRSLAGFDLGFRHAPGHSPCSMLTLIGEGYVHVADNVMTSNDGRDILPWAAFERIGDHIASLETLRSLSKRTFVLSHGIVLDDERTRIEALDNRIAYFRAVLEGDGRIPYEEAVRECTCEFLHSEWFIRKA